MNKFLSRLTSSDRGEKFNPLSWPFLLATASYGIGFLFFRFTDAIGSSNLYLAMDGISSAIPWLWGIVAILTIGIGITFLLWKQPPAGRISGITGFMLWVFAGCCYLAVGAWLQVFAIAVPNAWFWVWQYFSLSKYRREEAHDKAVMEAYEDGQYDDEDETLQHGIDQRADNRGVDRQ